MRKAYDTFLLSEVSADLAAKAGSFEPYRYECAHCGEEVRLAAVGSTSMVPHFRHRSGNSDIECEYYLGQFSAITDARSRKSKNERAEFYFDSNTKMFYLGLRFSEDEISAYEQLSTIFELRVASQAQPFYSLQINGRNFTSDMQRLIPLEKFSYSYFLSNTLNGVKRKYEVFNNVANNAATFFKMQVGDSDYRAKLVRSAVLYTNIPYFIAFQSQSHHWSPIDIRLPREIRVESTFKFETMGRKFLGKILTITAKTAQIDSLLFSWGYQLESSEKLTLLWPPAILSEDISIINADTAYLYSTFELQAHGNINVHSEDITKIVDGLTKIAVKPRIKVYKKNAELMLETCERETDTHINILVARTVEKNYRVPDDVSFLFNRSGVLLLSKGVTVQMTPDSEVRHYTNGYLDGIVAPSEQAMLVGESLLQDALIHYKRMETFNWADFKSLDLSQIAFQYIEDCEKSGLINSAAKHFIEEGRI
ncbi:hypothetical protein Dhaf_0628 [Desulfitobacterium hafniense DCB-2]|uniref:Uncharacterized protein n=2 Tax=Desulfitobacterium hafniense TaxID=49338 RepID=A0A098AX27_DESHA|nr:hypothetical protein [Desulfitobacterium hafniense]ACL18694.1 hypothetical protein Dhaf_0628 [Desulfitobacterium hafniense DCB-2]CDX00660.1 Hypothetical protein DPCES_0773 [Desulfitobacterium hafniense]